MIRSVRYNRSGLQTSRLAFGLSRLHHLASSNERQRLLAYAVELGFRHFDVARCYGDGLAERELGLFVRGRRDRLIIATKYGLPANPVIEALPAVAKPVRAARKLARHVGFNLGRPPKMNAKGLRQSLELSLRALKVDAIDILFLHEPSLERISEPAELLAEANQQKARGAIRLIGLSGDWPFIAEVWKKHESLADVVQVPENQWEAAAFIPDLTFSALRRGPQFYREPRIDPQLAVSHLKQALRRRPNGTVIVSTTRAKHLWQLASAESEVALP